MTDPIEQLVVAAKDCDPSLGNLLALIDGLPDDDFKRELKPLAGELLLVQLRVIERIFKSRPDLRHLDE